MIFEHTHKWAYHRTLGWPKDTLPYHLLQLFVNLKFQLFGYAIRRLPYRKKIGCDYDVMYHFVSKPGRILETVSIAVQHFQ